MHDCRVSAQRDTQIMRLDNVFGCKQSMHSHSTARWTSNEASKEADCTLLGLDDSDPGDQMSVLEG